MTNHGFRTVMYPDNRIHAMIRGIRGLFSIICYLLLISLVGKAMGD